MAESERSLYDQTQPNYRKAYIALESDPEIFTELAHNLGAEGVEFHDIISLDPEMLLFIPRPVLGFILVLPPSPRYFEEFEEREKAMSVYHGKGDDEPTIWFSQSIQNACGLYAILHALSNGIDRSKISGSPRDTESFVSPLTDKQNLGRPWTTC
jgi:ubiquitin carboxyl-terminal hydrolase L3